MNVLIAEILVLDDAVDGSRVYRPLFSSRFSMMEEPPMNLMTKQDEPPNLESLVAELTEAAYPVALRHRGRGSWVDLELDLWRALEQVLCKWQRQESRLPKKQQTVYEVPSRSEVSRSPEAQMEQRCAHESQ